ncbi:Uma2 family endonuclease, partial [Frankia sp. Cpl3]|nr:Uma2 family endonuclease [Frankia sp. Cpl3]
CKKEVKTEYSAVKEQQESYLDERYELIEGIRYDCKPSPTVDHQLLVGELSALLRTTCHQQGIILIAPMDVYLDEDNVVQPDVIYIAEERVQIVTRRRIEGVPDLVAEIISPSTGSRDKTRKKALYARFGVKEYWIVDPHIRTIDQFVLDGNTYHLLATYAPGDTLLSEQFACVSIDLTTLFAPLERFRED